eukprot:4788633-Amphidinium_carterae.1
MEVGTGEGKSMIIAALAIYVVAMLRTVGANSLVGISVAVHVTSVCVRACFSPQRHVEHEAFTSAKYASAVPNELEWPVECTAMSASLQLALGGLATFAAIWFKQRLATSKIWPTSQPALDSIKDGSSHRSKPVSKVPQRQQGIFSRVSHLICRRVREANVYCELRSCLVKAEE